MPVAIDPPDVSRVISEGDDECPICLDSMPPLTFRRSERCHKVCCGKLVCGDCLGNIHDQENSIAQSITTMAQGNPIDIPGLVESIRELGGVTACPMCRSQPPSSPKESFDMTMKHAKKGLAWAQWNIGYCYEHGFGVAINKREAAKWFELGAKQGHPWSMTSFGGCLEFGNGVRKSELEAKKWYEKSAKTGHAVAQHNLSTMYYQGSKGIPKNRLEAARLVRLSAEQGYHPAECTLGYCYQRGAEGIPRDLDKALLWYTRAAEQGNAMAMNNIGAVLMHRAANEYGSAEIAGKCPIPLAMKWGRKAAAKGDHDATQTVAHMEASLSSLCMNCRAPKPANSKLLRCAKCKCMYYCSKACQAQHWKAGHKKDCCEQN